MKSVIAFFEIPTTDFERGVKFYESVLGIELPMMDCGGEKMAFFPEEDGLCPGTVFWAEGYRPSSSGVVINLQVESLEVALAAVEKNGGKVVHPKTKIEAEGRGYFALFIDSEGNKLGLYADS